MKSFTKLLLSLTLLFNFFSGNTQPCAPTILPFSENFDGVTAPALPACMTVDYAGGPGSWVTAAYNFSSSPNAIRHSSINSSSPSDDWFFLRGLMLTAGTPYLISFKYAAGDPTRTEKFEVRATTTPNAQVAASTGIQVFDKTNITSTGTGSGLFIPATTGIYYFGFRAYSDPGTFYLYIDDISVSVAPSCTTPTHVLVNNISLNEATVSFTSASANVIVEYGAAGFTPGTGATAGTGGTVLNTSSPTLTINGLASATTYDVYVRQNCNGSGGGYSSNSQKASFSTLCNIGTTPYIETFDDVTAPAIPSCVTVENVNGSNTWTTSRSSWPGTSLPNTMYYWANRTTPADDWFFIKGINLIGHVPYYVSFRYAGSIYTTEKMEVRASTAPNSVAALAGTQIFNNTNVGNSDYANAYFTPDSTGTYYFGFHAYSDANQRVLYVDNVTVRMVCTPTTTPTIDSITANTALVRFTSGLPATNYIVEYGPPGYTPNNSGIANPGGTIVNGTRSPITLTGLSNGTSYDVYVRQNCASEQSGYSANTTKVTFNTACGPATLPYSENFDRVNAPDLPLCVTVENTNGFNTWAVAASTPSSSFSSPNTMKYTYSSTNAADDWFFVKAFNLTAGSTYKLNFKFSGTALEVRVGNAPTSTAALNGLQLFNYNSTTPFLGGGAAEFTPTSSGIYYFGFHVYSPANQNTVYVDDVNVSLLTACSTPKNVRIDSVTTTSALVTYQPTGNPVVIEYGLNRYTPGTGASAGTVGVVTTATNSPVSLNALTPNTRYYVYIRQNCSGAGNGFSSNQFIDSFKTLALPPANDLPTGALQLQLGTGCTGAAYSNLGGTKLPNEPGITSSGSQTAGKSVWFKFLAPASGFVRVSTDGSSNTLSDTKIALYAATDPANYSTFQIVACDDDNGVLNNTASILYATDLTPGQMYYIVVDDYAGTQTGNFCLKVDEANANMIAGSGSCTQGQTIPQFAADYNGWASLVDNNGQLIANVRSNTTLNTIADYTPYLNVHTSSTRQAATGEYYLGRNYRISNSLPGNYDVQFFFLNSDLVRLQLYAPLALLPNLNVTKVKGETTCNPNFISGGIGNDTLLLQTSSGTANNVSWVQVNTAGFSNFYLHAGTTQLSRLYVFTGNGNWSNAANWNNNEVPPSQLPPHCAIEIRPATGGQCILDVPQYIPQGSSFRVQSGTNIVIPGSILVH